MATKKRIYKIINHKTGETRIIEAFNNWQAVSFVAKDDYSCEPMSAVELAPLLSGGTKIEAA